jgi:hypothetical protein
MADDEQEVLAMPDAPEAPTKWVPPYISFRTLLNVLDRMQTEGVPPRIDRGFLDNLSGGYQTQVLATLKALDLIGDDGEVKPLLEELATKPNERKERIGGVVKRFYPAQVGLGAINATRLQLDEEFKKYEITGATLRKAVAFFLHAANYADIPLSPYFGKVTTASVGRKAPRKRRQTPPTPTPSPTGTANASEGISPLRKQYVEMLLKKAESQDEMDEGLLDRIETLLGFEGQATREEGEREEGEPEE